MRLRERSGEERRSSPSQPEGWREWEGFPEEVSMCWTLKDSRMGMGGGGMGQASQVQSEGREQRHSFTHPEGPW